MFSTLACAVLLVLLLAACSGEGGRLQKAEYERRVAELVLDVSGAYQLSAETPADELLPQLGRALEVLRAARGEFAKLSPPEEVEEAHALLVEGVSELADDVEQLIAELEQIEDPVERRDAVGDLRQFEALRKVEEAQRQFNLLGYSFE